MIHSTQMNQVYIFLNKWNNKWTFGNQSNNFHIFPLGNLCAVGYVTPIIEVWDLDIVNCVKPAIRLGKKGNIRTGAPRIGHKKAVLDLSWNVNFRYRLNCKHFTQSCGVF